MRNFKRLWSFLLVVLLASAIFPTTAFAGVNGQNTHTFQIGVSISSSGNMYNTSTLASVSISSGPLPAGVSFNQVSNLNWWQFQGTSAPGTAGTYPITLIDSGDSGTMNVTITVDPGPQTIVQGDINRKMSDVGTTVQLTQTANNGNGDTIPQGSTDAPTLAYSGGTVGIAQVNGTGLVTIEGKGTTTVDIDSAATGSYTVATQKPVTITVNNADPTVTLSGAAPSGTVGAVGDKTVAVTVANSYNEAINFTCNINGIAKIASRLGNGTVSFNFTAAELDVLAAGNYNITVSSVATTNNNAIAGTVVGTLAVNSPASPPGGGWYSPPATPKPPAPAPTIFPAQGTVTGKRIIAYTLDTLKGKTAFRLNKNEQFTLLELAANGKALLIQMGDLKGYIAIKDIRATFGAQLRGTTTAKKASVYTVQANGKLKRIGYYPNGQVIGISGVDGGYLISKQPSITYYLKTGEWKLAKQ